MHNLCTSFPSSGVLLIGGIPRPTGKELRAYRTSGLVHDHRLVSGFRASLTGEPVGRRCGPRLARGCTGVGFAGWAGAVWSSYPAGEGFAALVRELFIIFMPVGILLGDLQPIWGGLVWVALGYALWSHSSRGAATQQPSRVR